MSAVGTLFIVPTPIGNLQDITLRSVDILRAVDLIAAEDTRHSSRLLSHYDISTKTLSLHDHNEAQRTQELIAKIQQGQSVALISDAGTPLISDPGYVLVRQCRQQKVPVVALPGACALTTALSASGLATDKFAFHGFLPVKAQAKAGAIKSLALSGQTTIFYEAPRRIKDTLACCIENLPEGHEVVLAKELTKTFEKYVTGSASEVLDWLLEDDVHQKGEFVLMIYCPARNAQDAFPALAINLLTDLIEHMPPKQACAIVAKHFDLKKNALYKHVLLNSENAK